MLSCFSGALTLIEVFLRLFIISTMKSLFFVNSSSVILPDPSNRKTRSTVFFVHSEKNIWSEILERNILQEKNIKVNILMQKEQNIITIELEKFTVFKCVLPWFRILKQCHRERVFPIKCSWLIFVIFIQWIGSVFVL